VYTSRRLQALTFARNRRMDSLLHLASGYIVTVLVRGGIGNLVIGKNDGWKQDVEMGKRSNQNFVSIPHSRFIDMLTYKAQMVGIRVILTQENHTSKYSFFDREPICHHDQYMGKRIKRGLFRASDGRTIHADLNGSYNIVRKVVPHAFDSVPSVATNARRLNPIDMQKHLQMWKTP
jgi:putative transposase